MIYPYIYQEEEDFKYDILNSLEDISDCYEGVTFIKDVEKEEFVDLHRSKLIPFTKISCILETEQYDKDLLLILIQKTEVDIVWGFKRLAKNTNVYKKLEKKTSVVRCTSLSKYKEKKIFVQALCKKHSVPFLYVDALMLLASSSKFTIENEILKLSYAIKCGLDNPAEVLSTYEDSADVLNFTSCLFSDQAKAHFYIDKLVTYKTNYYLIQSILHKKLSYYLHLAWDNETGAKKYWNSNAYFLQQDKNFVDKYGKVKLLYTYKYFTRLFSTYFTDEEDLRLRLCQLLQFIQRCSHENDNCWV